MAFSVVLIVTLAAVFCRAQPPENLPTDRPPIMPTDRPPVMPADRPVIMPTDRPVIMPTDRPVMPTDRPVIMPTDRPVIMPTDRPPVMPTDRPVIMPTDRPVIMPTDRPAILPTDLPAILPTDRPAIMPPPMVPIMPPPKLPELCDMSTEKSVALFEYWISVEGEKDLLNGTEVLLDGDKNVELTRCDKSIKSPMVSKTMYDACRTQQTCRLKDGSIFELVQEKGADCFSQLNTTTHPWGFGWAPLNLFTSVSSRGHPLGATLIIKELINAILPNTNVKHNGCVRVDDTFIAKDDVNPCDIHLQIGYYTMFKLYNWPKTVTITEEKCLIQKYD